MSAPDPDDGAVQSVVIEFRGRSLAAGGAVSSQVEAFRYSGGQTAGAGRGIPVGNRFGGLAARRPHRDLTVMGTGGQ
ncbi:hypothetical protein GCM10017786_30470 [Amycolatopsis deserti]|uniref:Uncharacterized protein n=1 Tax=Amycolatopsis deserti TaxID=185696 RepID=A0ABQ3IVM7_9PSEU|nr:hypothetical protein GCM10017786_30470 [Amycolatopsis deserti]